MTKIEWKIGPARLRNGEECEIVAILPSGKPVVSKWPTEVVYWLCGGNPNGFPQYDLIPPRERREGYLWVCKSDGGIEHIRSHKNYNERINNIPIALERNDAGDWELVK
jgi:hypothetical protein